MPRVLGGERRQGDGIAASLELGKGTGRLKAQQRGGETLSYPERA